MTSKSLSRQDNMYKYLRGSIGAKDGYQIFEEDYKLENHSKSEKQLKNPYLQYNVKNIKNQKAQIQQNIRIKYTSQKKIKVVRTKEFEGKEVSTTEVGDYEKLKLQNAQSAQNLEGVGEQDIDQAKDNQKSDLFFKTTSVATDIRKSEEESPQRLKTRDKKQEKLPLNLLNANKSSLQNTQKSNQQLAETLDIYSQSNGIYHLMQKSLSNVPSYGNMRSTYSQSVDRKYHHLPQLQQIDKSDEPLLIKLIRHQQLLEKEKSSRVRQSYLQRKSDFQNIKNQHSQNLKAKEKESNKIQEELRKKIDVYKYELQKERQTKQTIQQLTEQLKILMKNQNLMNKSLLPYISVKDTLAFFSQNQIFQFFYIGKGNNSDIVRRVLETRVLMQEVDELHPEVNFEWHPFSRPIQFVKLGTKNEILLHKKVVNHFEFHHEITTKSSLVKNMKNYCAENKLDVFGYTPITFEINVDGNNFMNEMRIFLQYYMKNLPSHLKTQRDSIEIKKKNGKISFQLRPTETNSNSNDKKETNVPSATNFIMKDSYLAEGKSPYVWLLKPVNLNRGRGIEVFSTLEELEKLVNEYYIGFPEKSFKEEQEKLLEEQEKLIEEQEKISDGQEKVLQEQKEIQIPSQTAIRMNEQRDNNIQLENKKQLFFKEREEVENQEQKIEPSTDDKSEESDEQKDKQVKFQLGNDQFQSNNSIIGKQNKDKSHKVGQQIIPAQQQMKYLPTDKVGINAQPNIAKSMNLLPRKPQTANISNIQMTSSNVQSSRKGGMQHTRSSTQIKEKQKFIISENQFVIQKYIERPLLINQRKFDIRVWVLVTQSMEVFVFKQGYLRMSSEVYDISDLHNPFIHLTNNAVQQHSKNYGKFENGNQMSFPEFQVFLDTNLPGKNYTIKDTIFPQMEEEIKISLMGIKNKLNMNQRPNCFEIFGYDFIIDNLCNVWIIEVNTNPCIEESSPILKVLIPRMLDDAFKLTIDQMLSVNLSQRTIKYPVTGYLDDDNMWKFVCALQPSNSSNRYQSNNN